MANISNTLVNNFNGGLLTPQMSARLDFDKYYSGCSEITNFIVQPWGGAQNRAGYLFIHNTKYNNKDTILIDFEYSPEYCYMIETGDEYFRFYYNDGIVIKDGKIYEIKSCYTENELRKIKYIQSNDVLFMAHPYHPVSQLMCYASDNWKFEDMPLKNGPFQDENDTDTEVQPDGNTGYITITASDDIFEEGMEGGLFRINYPRKDNSVSKKFEKDGSTDPINVKGKWKVETSGNWQGTLKLMRSYDDGKTWSYYRSWTSNHDRNIDSEGTIIENDIKLRLDMTAYQGGGGYFCNATLSCSDYMVKGIVEIAVIVNSKKIEAYVIDPLGMSDKNTPSKEWSFGSFSPYFGFPENICFFNDRLVLSFTRKQPNTIWMSCTGDYSNFEEGDADDRAITLTIRTAKVNSIEWMIPRKYLMLGTNVEIGAVKEETSGEILSPTNRKYESQLKVGSSDIDAVEVDSVILFAMRQGSAVRELAYNWQEENYVAPDMTELCPEVVNSPIVTMKKQSAPYSILWCLREDGQLAGFTYNRLQNVTGWHRHITKGHIIDQNVLNKTKSDEVWIIVDRETPGGISRCIEKQAKRIDDAVKSVFLDSSMQFIAGEEMNIQNIYTGKQTLLEYPGHGLRDGNRIRIYDVRGCLEINNIYTAFVLSEDVIRLRDIDDMVDIDSSSWGEYTDGGNFVRVVKSVSGFDHLEGVKITVLADGYVSSATVKDGGFSFPNWSTVILGGLGYESVLAPMPLDYAGENGTTIGRVRRISKNRLKVYKSLGGKTGDSKETASDIVYSITQDRMGKNPELKTKTMFVNCAGTYDYEKTPVIIQDQPFPLTVLALISEMQFYGG